MICKKVLKNHLKNIERQTVHTIVALPNPEWWLKIHISHFIMIVWCVNFCVCCYFSQCNLFNHLPLYCRIYTWANSATSNYPNQCWFIANWTLGSKLQWNLSKKKIFSLTKMHSKISSAKWRPFCPWVDELTYRINPLLFQISVGVGFDAGQRVFMSTTTPNCTSPIIAISIASNSTVEWEFVTKIYNPAETPETSPNVTSPSEVDVTTSSEVTTPLPEDDVTTSNPLSEDFIASTSFQGTHWTITAPLLLKKWHVIKNVTYTIYVMKTQLLLLKDVLTTFCWNYDSTFTSKGCFNNMDIKQIKTSLCTQ